MVGYAGLIVRKTTTNTPLVRLARDAIATYAREGKVINPPGELTPEMKEHAGVFVSLHENGELRGCIGTIEPSQRNVAREVIQNAISAATRDPRFEPVTVDEVPKLEINVDVLTAPEPVASAAELDVKKYGLVVECGYRRGLLLPDIEGVANVEEQINICRVKGGIGPHEKCQLYRFEVKRYR